MKKLDWAIAAAAGAVAGLIYSLNVAQYAFPGESARLITLWAGLDSASVNPHPLMGLFARLLGGGNALSAVCGAVAVALVFLIVCRFTRAMLEDSAVEAGVDSTSRLAGLVAATVFMFTPAVMRGASCLSPEMFDTAWMLMALALVLLYATSPRTLAAWLCPPVVGIACGLALADSLATLPATLVLAALIIPSALRRGGNPGLAVFFALMFFLASFFVFAPNASGDFTGSLREGWRALAALWTRQGAIAAFMVATFPAVLAAFAAKRAVRGTGGITLWTFNLALLFMAIIATATPASPSSLLSDTGYLPVATCFFASILASYAFTYWFMQLRSKERAARLISLAVLPVFAGVLAISAAINAFSFDRNAGAFADRMAERIVENLGERNWFVTEGTLDEHLRLAARRLGRDVKLICLQRDDDETYVSNLREAIREAKLGGPKNEELLLSLSLGVLTFVQDWFAADPSVASSVAVFGAPDIWYSAGIKPVPELLFFGADRDKAVDWSAWKDIDSLLSAPKGWGSYRLRRNRNPLDYRRLSLRRHMGLMANNRGVFLQDEKKDAEAWRMYELVRNEIDRDNICALFNEFEMARAGYSEAAKKRNEIEKAFKTIIADKDRRYMLWQLANYYGYIRSPEIFVRLGFRWARSGRPGDALAQIRRAIDFIPTDKRSSLMNMMAALYASDANVVKSRKLYEEVLSRNDRDHDALIGMMRIELLEGDPAKAVEYLERAAKCGQGEKAKTELAMVHLMKNRLDEAHALLKSVIDATPGDMLAWSLMAAVTMQRCDAAKTDKEKKALTEELERVVLPAMEKQARSPFDYYVQTTRAFLLMRQGAARRREARDAFVSAAKSRPDVAATQDIVLGLDISLNDTADAEKHARQVLRRNRKAPLANYVMGALALQKGDYSSAEAFLRRSADATRPVAIAQNDLAEVLRRQRRLTEAEHYARLAVKNAPSLYIAWETLASVLLDAKHANLAEVEQCAQKAVDLAQKSQGAAGDDDLRVLMTLARVQSLKGDKIRARGTLRKVQSQVDRLSEFEKIEFEELRKSVK